MSIVPWFERWPDLLDRQLRALDAAGIPYRIDDESRNRGDLVLEVTPVVDGAPLNLIVTFPGIFPYCRFQVLAPGLNLEHHQHPFAKNLCLIGRASVNWHEGDTIAAYLQERLPLVLRAGRSRDVGEVAAIEERQAEPFSDYYAYLDGTMLLIDGLSDLDPSVPGGRMSVGILGQDGIRLRGVVLALEDADGHMLAQADPVFAERCITRINGRWVRRPSPIRAGDAAAFAASLVSQVSELAHPAWSRVPGWKLDLVGVVFPEEIGWRKVGDGWVFLVRGEELKDPGRRKKGAYLARAARAGKADLAARVPELYGLHDRVVAVVGLGGLGCPSALEFARAGVGQLRILDGDVVDPGTSVRWPFGLAAAGMRKVDVVRDFIREHYPHVRVRGVHRRLGLAGAQPPDLEALHEFLDGVSLIYDATAEVDLQHLLADLAHERRIPYVSVSSTAGAWGGLVIRIRPDRTAGCWVCSQWALQDNSVPTPPADPRGGVQPAGCANPTFTGAGFDLGQVALAGVRVAVAALSAGVVGGYPDFDWDVAVISLRDNDGRPIPPSWSTFPLKRHPSCGCAAA